ncbi:TPA: hypothetical protein ACGPAL_000449 [Streptococcus suis]
MGDTGPKGDRGNDGIAGRDGVGIRSTVVTYGISSSDSVQPSTWSSNVPTLVKGQYLWTRTVWTYTDNHTETGYQKTYISRDGNNGRDGIAGKDGVGIRSTTITYAASSSGTTAPSSGWVSNPPVVSAGQYLWTKTVWTYTDNSSETGYSVAKMGDTGPKGDRGNDGLPGRDGVGIRSTVVTYGISSSDSVQPSSWSSNVPTLVKGQYLWTRTVWTYTDNHTETGYQKTYISRDGNNGRDGVPGKDGVGIRSTVISYAVSTSGTSAPTVGWGEQVPSVPNGQYLWTRTVYTYTDNDTETAYSVSKMGTDGKTTYPHYAYSDSADGSGLVFTDTGQRYQGYYSDYTQADSTDKTRYRWADRWARLKLEDNLLLNSSFNENLDQWQGNGVTIVGGKARITGEFNKTKYIYQSIKSQTANDDVNQVYIASVAVKVSNYVAGRNPFFALFIDGRKNDSRNTQFGGTYLTANRLDAVNNRGVVQFATTFRINVPRNQIKLLDFHIYSRDFTGEVEFEKVSLRRGNIDLGWQASPEDLQNQLNSKADQALTQEQLNALNERAGILQAELEAKASAATLDNWIKAYQNFVKANGEERVQAEKELIAASQRIAVLETNVGDMAQRWNFVDKYMQVTNEGLVFGKQDASSTIKISDDRISMFSAGAEVMYISQGVIHIENGIFSKTIQIGRFREEQYHLNLDMNVIRYVGGL